MAIRAIALVYLYHRNRKLFLEHGWEIGGELLATSTYSHI